MSNVSKQTIDRCIEALSDIRDGLEEQIVYDDENDCFLDCQDNTDRIYVTGLISDLEETL